MPRSLVDAIDAILPQTQCTQCDFDGCRPYAQAIANGTPHNQCPPGGARVIDALSQLLQRDALPLNPHNGVHKPKAVAVIREDACIGCTKCIKACPVDAIAGTGKMMHTVIADECTGCELCVEPCPTDCIDMITLPDTQQPDTFTATERTAQSDHYRRRHQAHLRRIKSIENAEQLKYQRHKKLGEAQSTDRQAKQDYIAAALARAKAKRNPS